MIYRDPEIAYGRKKQAFNNILEKVIKPKRHNYILDLDDSVNQNSYGHTHDMKAATRIDIWANINHQLEEFDHQKRSLKPGTGENKQCESSQDKKPDAEAKMQVKVIRDRREVSRRLPSPPPEDHYSRPRIDERRYHNLNYNRSRNNHDRDLY